MPPKGSKQVECPACGGTGTVSVGDVDMPCEACDSKGTVVQAPDTKDIKHGNQK